MFSNKLLFFTLLSLSPTSQSTCNEEETCHHRVRRIVGGDVANYPPYDDPVVYVRFNGRSARVLGTRDYPHYVFKGIKYAHPPVGADRFLRPREKFLEGEVKATLYGPPCLQPVPGANILIGNEDCLSLNIFTPDLPTGTEGLPVVIWIHGGGFRYGSASQYGVRHLVGQRLLVVSIQYRLGSLGFLSSGTKHLPGNAALWDMALAVQWVRNYIGFFGGNPHRIVVMGHDTGASSAVLLALTKIAKGMPSGVIAMSGTAVSRWAIDEGPSNTAKEVAEENGCPTANVVTMVKCLQKVPAESIVKGDSTIEFRKLQSKGFVSGLNGRLATAPVAEGENDRRAPPGLVEDDPVDSLYNQSNPKIPLLTGVTKDETKNAVKGHYKKDIIHQLQTVPNFVNKILLETLQDTPVISKLTGRLGNIGNIGNLSVASEAGDVLGGVGSTLTPVNFDNYLGTKTGDLNEGLDKISEATADALFNVPAFLTAQFWKGASTFLYSFEHVGKMHRGFSFLRGLPLVGNVSMGVSTNDTVGHGDELAYIFDAQDFEGNPLPIEAPTEDDIKVRNLFTRMIADFVRHGEITINKKKAPPFNSGNSNFIQVKPKPVLSNKFRFCEMALWTNIGERLKSGTCQFLRAFDVPGISNTLLDPAKNIGGVGNVVPALSGGNINQNENMNPLGLLGGGSQQQTKADNTWRNTNKNPLGGFIG